MSKAPAGLLVAARVRGMIGNADFAVQVAPLWGWGCLGPLMIFDWILGLDEPYGENACRKRPRARGRGKMPRPGRAPLRRACGA